MPDAISLRTTAKSGEAKASSRATLADPRRATRHMRGRGRVREVGRDDRRGGASCCGSLEEGTPVNAPLQQIVEMLVHRLHALLPFSRDCADRAFAWYRANAQPPIRTKRPA